MQGSQLGSVVVNFPVFRFVYKQQLPIMSYMTEAKSVRVENVSWISLASKLSLMWSFDFNEDERTREIANTKFRKQSTHRNKNNPLTVA